MSSSMTLIIRAPLGPVTLRSAVTKRTLQRIKVLKPDDDNSINQSHWYQRI